MSVINIEDCRQKRDLEREIEEFRDNLMEAVNPLGHRRTREKLILLQAKLNGTEERGIPEEELEKIYSQYRRDSLHALGNALEAFYILRNSETSRILDVSAWFTKLLKVPDSEYLDTVLENTPKTYRMNELNAQLKSRKVTDTELQGLLDKHGLEDYTISVRS